MSKAYCEKCDRMREYVITEPIWEKLQIDDVVFHAWQKHAYCAECGEEVEPAELSVYNINEANDSYREAIGSISVKDIQEILDRYHIAKEALSLLLGWGQNTIARQMKHNIPSREYASKLKSLLNAQNMYDLLQSNGHVLTNVAFRKAMDATEKILGASSYISFRNNVVWDMFTVQSKHIRTNSQIFDGPAEASLQINPCIFDNALVLAEAI